MIDFLRGTLVGGGETLVLEVSGIGFAIQVSARTAQRLPRVGSALLLYTWLQVRQDGVSLYGFLEAAERDLFLLMQEVNGMGPKVAMNLLSTFAWESLGYTIGQGDVAALVKVPGVGPKLAQRLVLELKEKLRRRGLAVRSTGNLAEVSEALAALGALGYTPAEAEPVVAQARKALGESSPVEDLVSFCLKVFGQRSRQ